MFYSTKSGANNMFNLDTLSLVIPFPCNCATPCDSEELLFADKDGGKTRQWKSNCTVQAPAIPQRDHRHVNRRSGKTARRSNERRGH
jgi:hypothetical protein